MPLLLIQKNITTMEVDAIVNSTNENLSSDEKFLGGIHHVAGPELAKECADLGGCQTGEAKITKGYNLPCKYVIHTVGPVWEGDSLDVSRLRSCYIQSLLLAQQYGAESIAFPLISPGDDYSSQEKAFSVAYRTIQSFLQYSDMTVYLITYIDLANTYPQILHRLLLHYIHDNYQEERLYYKRCPDMLNFMPAPKEHSDALSEKIKKEISKLDESFAEMLFRLIDKKGITDVECYKRANVSKKVFSRMRSEADYKPSKQTAVAYALALELPMEDAKRLIELAGYSISHNNIFDVIIEFCITHKEYNVYTVNQILFSFDQKLLGSYS